MNDQNQAPAQQPPEEDDPNVIGRLNDEEMAQWAQARQMGQQTLMELGNMFMRGVRMVGQVDRAEAQVRQMLQGAAKRMGLADDVKFQALPDGRIRVIADIQPVAPGAEAPADAAPADEAPAEESEAPAEEAKAEAAEPTEAEKAAAAGLPDPDDPDPMASVARAKAAIEGEKAKEAESPPPG